MNCLLIAFFVAFFAAGYWCGRDQANSKHEVDDLCRLIDGIMEKNA